jgi:hypothetical protein
MCNRSTITLLALALIQVQVASVTKAQENAPKAAVPQAPVGYVLVEEDQWHKLADEPDRHIGRAREAYLMQDARTAAAELRKAAVHVRIAAGHAAERGKAALLRSEHELEHTARRIEEGAVQSVEELDFASARALHALSDYQYAKAADAWRRREARQAGQYLRAAANNLERAAARTDATMRAATAEVVKDSRLISGTLVEGTGFVIDEVGAGFEAIGHELERVGTRLNPRIPSK